MEEIKNKVVATDGQKKAKLSLIFMGIGIVLFLTIIPSVVMFILSIINGAKALKAKVNSSLPIISIIVSSISLFFELLIVTPVFLMNLIKYLNML